MFNATRYLVFDSLVPPDSERLLSQDSQLRLETLCALVIARSKVSCHLLSNTPTHLHKIIWAAYLTDEYYKHREKMDLKEEVPIGETELFLDVVPELLYHWPHKEFILGEIMPTLPPRPNRVSDVCYWGDLVGPILQSHSYLFSFYDYVVNAMVRCCIDNNGRFPEQHNNYGNIRKINVSGFNIFRFTDIASLTGIIDPFYKNKDGQLEIMLDFEFDCGNIESLENWFTHCYSNSTDYLVIKVGRIQIYHTNNTEVVTKIITKLINDGTYSIRLLDHIEGSAVIEKVFENANQKNISAIEIYCGVTSLNIMLYFVNLIYLDLSDNDLHDQLNFLLHMHRGLLFLRLEGCNLENKDLDKLIRSCHLSTLRELHLDDNLFKYDDSSEYLIKLCGSLSNVLELHLGFCDLESWPCKFIRLLFNSFTKMSNVIYLGLYGNDFGMDVITTYVRIFKQCSSLRYLHLSLPPEINVNQLNCEDKLIKSFYAEVNGKINKNCILLLYVKLDN